MCTTAYHNATFSDCGNPQSIKDGNFTVTSYETVVNATNILNVTQKVLYSCKEGFVFHPDSTGLLECNAGKFEPSLPECERRKLEKIIKLLSIGL